MAKVAFVFPGQGAQYPGMGRSLCDVSPAAAEVFRMADSIRPGTSRQCFEGTDDELKQTAITQPCLWTVEMAAAAALTEAGIRADICAGFSLGELAALSFARIVDISTCFDLVCRGSVAEGCKLHLEEQEAECWCETCQQYVTLLTQRVRRCPQCHGDMLQIVADDGLQIRRIEIDQE